MVFGRAPGESNARRCKTRALAGRLEARVTGTAFDDFGTVRRICAFRSSLFVVARHDDERGWARLPPSFRRLSYQSRFQGWASFSGLGERMRTAVAGGYLPLQNGCISPCPDKCDPRRRCVVIDEQGSRPRPCVELGLRTRRHHAFIQSSKVLLPSLAWPEVMHAMNARCPAQTVRRNLARLRPAR